MPSCTTDVSVELEASGFTHTPAQSASLASQFTWKVMLAKVLVWGTAWAFLT